MSWILKVKSALGMTPPPVSGKIAMDRLSVMISCERGSRFLENIDQQALIRDLTSVMHKYFESQIIEGKNVNLSRKFQKLLFHVT